MYSTLNQHVTIVRFDRVCGCGPVKGPVTLHIDAHSPQMKVFVDNRLAPKHTTNQNVSSSGGAGAIPGLLFVPTMPLPSNIYPTGHGENHL